MRIIPIPMTDLRELAAKHLGTPLAISANAALWHCPVCPPDRHSLLLVSATQHKCLGCIGCNGGINDWTDFDDSDAESIALGVPA